MSRPVPILAAAKRALACGISVVPPAEDGTKRPLVSWKRYQSEHADEATVASWYGPRTGLGFVTGSVSGGLELFEFDDASTYERFREAAAKLGGGPLVDRVEAGYFEETPGGGFHWLYFAPEPRGNTKLASRRSKQGVEVLIETRGEGGFVVVAPSHGKVHPSGKPYVLRSGGVDTVERLTSEERDWLWDLARTFDDTPPPAASHDQATETSYREGTGDWPDTLSPGADFNARTEWESVLTGWVHVYDRGDTQYWRRPGKEIGTSATVNHNNTDRLHVFTTSTEFSAGVSYSKFGAYAVLQHGGDHSAAAKFLYRQGYGTHKRWVRERGVWECRVFQNPVPRGERVARPGEQAPAVTDLGPPDAPKAPPAAPPRPPTAVAADLSSLSDADLGVTLASAVTPEPISWLWPNHIASGKLNLIAGEGGEGKSQVAITIAAAVSTGTAYPDGSVPDAVGNVFILAAEDGARDTIVPRLIAAQADTKRVHLGSARLTLRDAQGNARIHPVSFQDLDYWESVLKRFKIRLLIADPVPAYLGRGVNDHRNSEVRSVLEPFAELCNETGTAFVAITHVNKSTESRLPVHKILGSVAYYNIARTVHCVYRDEECEEKRHFCLVKANILPDQPSLDFVVTPVEFEHNGVTIKTSAVRFSGAAGDFDVVAHVAGQNGKRKGRPATMSVKIAEWLHEFLNDGRWVPLAQVADAAGSCGFLGEQKADGRYGSLNALYRGRDRLPSLEGDKAGWVIDEETLPFKGTGRNIKHWRLVRDTATVQTGSVDAEMDDDALAAAATERPATAGSWQGGGEDFDDDTPF